MTNEEAIYRLRNTAWLGNKSEEEETLKAIDMAVQALEKQIPKRPYRKTIHYPYMQDMDVCQCVTCLRRLRTTRTTAKGDAHCPKCGQAIDWSE